MRMHARWPWAPVPSSNTRCKHVDTAAGVDTAVGAVSCRTLNASAQAQPAPTSCRIAHADHAHQAKQKRITEHLCDVYQGNDKRSFTDIKTSVNKRANVMALGFKTKFLCCAGSHRHTMTAKMSWVDLARDARHSPACFDDERCGFALESSWRLI